MSLPARDQLDTPQQWDPFKGWLQQFWDHAASMPYANKARGSWAAGTAYAAGDYVERSGALYIAQSGHVSSGSFTADQTAGRWSFLDSALAAAVSINAKVAAVDGQIQAMLAELDAQAAVTETGQNRAAVAVDRAAIELVKGHVDGALDSILIAAGDFPTDAAGRAAVADGESYRVEGDGARVAVSRRRRINADESMITGIVPDSRLIEKMVDSAPGLYLSTSTSDVLPIAGDPNGGILLGVDAVSGTPVGVIPDRLRSDAQEFAAMGGAGIAKYDNPADDLLPIVGAPDAGGMNVQLGVYASTGMPAGDLAERIGALSGYSPVPLPMQARSVLAQVNGAPSLGQSNTVGAKGQPPLSTVQPYLNLTFAGGPKAAAGQTASKPCVEDSLSEGGVNSGDRGETICSGMVNWMTRLAMIENGFSAADLVMFTSAPGQGGQKIVNIKKGTVFYTRFLAHVTAAKAIATAAGKTYAVQFVAFIEGETDCDEGTSYATYLAEQLQIATDIDIDVRAITGQTAPVHMLLVQCSYRAVSSGGAIILAQNEAARQHPLIHLVNPTYYIPFSSDNLHRTNVGHLLQGRILGRAGKELVINGNVPSKVIGTSATAVGLELAVRCETPRQLVIDAKTYPATDYGIRVLDDTGTVPISNIRALGREVTMTLGRALGTNPRVRYGLDYLGAGLTITAGASGNLRDTTPDACLITDTSYSMAHRALAFQLPINVLELA
ncbi:hypothetical protein [Variovorax ginsengisoli]|uniref:Uncharacterized protein n=1 Tax=Variovorax ginsengisoli TaxID=363844 RepID=A0ABT9SE11_9BURK|nr:hypothetical protein [Variovorax ginsengisoli]MDP9902606.1 hypothetical protein [Variovorax ginsengisoli]